MDASRQSMPYDDTTRPSLMISVGSIPAPRRESIVPELVAGAISGTLIVTFGISLAALIFTGDLSRYVPAGIGVVLFSSFVIGATEIESGDMSPMSVRSTLELLSAAYAVHSGFGEARILELATHCRPTLPDHLPSLRWHGPRVLQVNGLYRHGFLLAPALLAMTRELLATGESPLAARFGLDPMAATAARDAA